ncbi:MAG: hypothetical protein ACHRHE_21715 [Tepidisphaerales bacterium]
MTTHKARRHEGRPLDYPGQAPARSGPRRLFIVAGALLAGCGGTDKTRTTTMPSTTRPVATDIDAEQAQPTYWLKQPATSEISFKDFQKLWDTCEAVSYDYLLKIDRRDYRHGLLTTQPRLSKQWFEPWRKDAPTVRDVEEASFGGIRRTIYFQFTQNLDSSFTVAPKVIVERQSRIDPKFLGDDPDQPTTYWYAVRRDSQLEIRIVAAIRERLDAGK